MSPELWIRSPTGPLGGSARRRDRAGGPDGGGGAEGGGGGVATDMDDYGVAMDMGDYLAIVVIAGWVASRTWVNA